MATRHDIIHKAASLPVGDPERKRLLASLRTARGMRLVPLEKAVIKYRVEHPEYGTFDLANNAEGSGWYLVATDPTPAAGVRRHKIISKVSFTPVSSNPTAAKILMAHVEDKLDRIAAGTLIVR